jgi:hypothetical protein
MAVPKTPVSRVTRLSEGAFAFWCADGPNAAELRRRHLEAHLAFVETNHDRYLAAGPMRRDGEQRLCGSLIVVVAESESDARRFVEGDPYFSEGVFESVECRRLTPAAGRWLGGVIWKDAHELRALADGGR